MKFARPTSVKPLVTIPPTSAASAFSPQKTPNSPYHCHLYVPPIRGGEKEDRQQLFDPAFLPHSKNDFLFGDVNCHSDLWDPSHDTDTIGAQIEDFISEHDFVCANDGTPTLLSKSAGTQSAPDVTIHHSSWINRVSWCVSNSVVGGSDHAAIVINIACERNLKAATVRRTKFAYRKAQWSKFAALITHGFDHGDSCDCISADVDFSRAAPAEKERAADTVRRISSKARLLPPAGALLAKLQEPVPAAAAQRCDQQSSPSRTDTAGSTTDTRRENLLPAYTSPLRHGPGIKQTGNTCFVAAGLSVLFGLPGFRASINSHTGICATPCVSCEVRSIMNTQNCSASATRLLDTPHLRRVFPSRRIQYECAQAMEEISNACAAPVTFITVLPSEDVINQLEFHRAVDIANSSSAPPIPQAIAIVVNRFLDHTAKDNTPTGIGDHLMYANTGFSLVGIVEHRGASPTAGHFICWSRRCNCWMMYNDSIITPGLPSRTERETACVMVFSRSSDTAQDVQGNAVQLDRPLVRKPAKLLPIYESRQRTSLGSSNQPASRPTIKSEMSNDKPEMNTVHHKYKQFCASVLHAAAKSIPRGSRQVPKCWWDDECDRSVATRASAREEACKDSNMKSAFNVACRETTKLLDAKRTDAWHKFATEDLSTSSNLSKIHRVIRAIDGRTPAAKPSSILKTTVSDGKSMHEKLLVSDKQKAEAFAAQYAETCRLYSRSSDRSTRFDNLASLKPENCACKRSTNADDLTACSPFSQEELVTVLSSLKKGRATGEDGVSNDMLANLPQSGRDRLLDLANDSLGCCQVPSGFRTGTIIPILKKGKSPADMASYRPITLTSCVAKVVEMMVRNRLTHILESRNLLTDFQAGFRCGRSTEDQISRLISHVSDGFQKRKRSVAAFVDFKRAFDTVYLQGLFAKLVKMGLPICLIRWIKEFLTDRRANVRFGDATSMKRKMTDGLPQGTGLGPVLFLCFINDLVSRLPDDCHVSLFADDICLWAQDDTIDGAAKRLESAIHCVESFAEEWKMTISTAKTTVVAFTLNTHEAKTIPCVRYRNGDMITFDPEPVFLGVSFDRTLSFRPHEVRISKKMKSRISVMRALSGTTWGCNAATLRQVYQCYVESVYKYAAGAWYNTGSATKGAPVSRPLVNRAHNQAARVITGCTKMTSIEKLTIEARLTPPDVTARILSASSLERHLRLPLHHPTRHTTSDETPDRCKSRRTWKGMAKATSQRCGLDGLPRQPVVLASPAPPWSVLRASVTFNTELRDPCRQTDDEIVKRARANRTIESLMRSTPGAVTIYTDGSVTDSINSGGGGIFFTKQNGTEFSAAIPTGRMSSSFASELAAINHALGLLDEVDPLADVLIFTDSQAAVRKLQAGARKQTHPTAIQIWDKFLVLFPIGGNRVCTLQFIPSHCGLEGNEKADDLARQGAAQPNDHAPIELSVACNRIAYLERARWRDSCVKIPYATPPIRAPPHVSRRIERIASQCRVESCPLFRNYLYRIGKAQTDRCRGCSIDKETAWHVVVECPAFQSKRLSILPCPPEMSFLHYKSATLVRFLDDVGFTARPNA
jgi:ribonuclease HI